MKICGIDEAGRGSIAGHLAICGCVLNHDIKGLDDSKKLSFKQRELLSIEIKQKSEFKIFLFNAKAIDKMGLSWCYKKALISIKKHFLNVNFIFDGNCNYGIENINTLVKADSKINEVKAASILAKTKRDSFMNLFHKKHPNHGFLNHKGYLTKQHKEMIKTHGYTKYHRKSFKISL